MRRIQASLLAGVAVAALVGFSGWAHAQSPQIHTMTVRLPGGGVEQIRYTGDTPPQVAVENDPVTVASLFGPESPFAAFDRVSALMDRQAAALLQETAAMDAQPVGTGGYAFCEQSVQITATGNGPPKVVRHTAGDCAPSGTAGATIGLPMAQPAPQRPAAIMTKAEPRPRHRPDVILTKAEGVRPYTRLAKEIPVSDR